jgi:predicted choloylglycine hydrolase
MADAFGAHGEFRFADDRYPSCKLWKNRLLTVEYNGIAVNIANAGDVQK